MVLGVLIPNGKLMGVGCLSSHAFYGMLNSKIACSKFRIYQIRIIQRITIWR